MLGRWPVGFGTMGWVYLEVARDDEIWNEAIETVKAMGNNDTPTLLKMRKALREASERRH